MNIADSVTAEIGHSAIYYMLSSTVIIKPKI